jgi:hypothetical protein
MSSYAGLTSLEIRHGAVSETTLDNLAVIKREAVRLANLVEQLKEVSLEKERELALVDNHCCRTFAAGSGFLQSNLSEK